MRSRTSWPTGPRVPLARSVRRRPAATVAAGVARANPPIPYAPDAYAPQRRPTAPPLAPTDTSDDRKGRGQWAWIAGLLGLGILLAVGFLAFRLLTGGSTAPAQQVVVPNFVGQTVEQATQLAEAKGLKLTPQFVKSNDQPEGTITAQDPLPNATVDAGSSITITVVSGQEVVAVPDVRNQPVAAAIRRSSGRPRPGHGDRGRSTRPCRPGSVISTSPASGYPGHDRDDRRLRRLEGPEPTPSPTPSPTPAPTPSPTPPPTRHARRR